MVELLIKENEEEVAGPTNVLGDDVDDDEEEDFSVEAQIR
jgi:hypothetical protein